MGKTTFDDIRQGDIINYDIPLLNEAVRNETSMVLEMNDTHIKLLNGRDIVDWVVSKKYFNNILMNLSIIESD